MNEKLLANLMGLSKFEPEKEILKAPMSYPGGKQRSIPILLKHIPVRGSYITVFGGAANDLLCREISALEVYNDRYGGVTQFYRCLRDPIKKNKLVELLQAVIHSREEFHFCRDSWEDCRDDVERAFRWYYATVFSFESQGRDFGRSLKGTNMLVRKLDGYIKSFEAIHCRMKDVLIENQDFQCIMEDFDKEDAVIYCDPPYLIESSAAIYGPKFSKDDHIRLIDTVFSRDCFVALSHYPCDLYLKQPWDQIIEYEVASSANGLASGGPAQRDKVKELLFIKESK